MKIEDIKQSAFSMPITSPSALKIEHQFKNREFFGINYESDIDVLRAVVPEPLQVVSPIVKFQFVKMPDAYGFGDYTLVSQLIEVMHEGKIGTYAYGMYLDNLAPIAAGREMLGFPEKYGNPKLAVDVDTIVGTLKYNSVSVATASMAYKYECLDTEQVHQELEKTPNYLLKIIPHANGQEASICQLVRYFLKDVKVIGAWSGPAALQLFEHALAPVAQLPVKRVISGTHVVADLTLGFGEVVYDYLN